MLTVQQGTETWIKKMRCTKFYQLLQQQLENWHLQYTDLERAKTDLCTRNKVDLVAEYHDSKKGQKPLWEDR
jgi:hypothetical protein